MLNNEELIKKVKSYNRFFNPDALTKAYNFAYFLGVLTPLANLFNQRCCVISCNVLNAQERIHFISVVIDSPFSGDLK